MSKKKIILFSVLFGTIIVAGGLFTLFKLAATPQRITMVSCINSYKDMKNSFQLFQYDEERLLKSLGSGRKIKFNATFPNIPIFGNIDISGVSNSDNSVSVSELTCGNDTKLTVYKDSQNMYINTPLFDGGFEIPLTDFYNSKENSALKGLNFIAPEKAKRILCTSAAIKFSMYDYAKNHGAELQNIIQKIIDNGNIHSAGKSSVMIAGNTKTADKYVISIDKSISSEFLNTVSKYIIQSQNISDKTVTEMIDNMFGHYEDDYTVTLLIKSLKIRELVFENSDGEKYTVSLQGGGNPFDIISIYQNGEVGNSLRRTHINSDTTITDEITQGEKKIMEFENSASQTKINIDTSAIKLSFQGNGKEISDDTISYGKANLAINDGDMITGKLSVSSTYDTDFSFSKKGDYINIFSLNETSWNTITATLKSLINFSVLK